MISSMGGLANVRILLLVATVVIWTGKSVSGSLTLRKVCGEIECQEYEYCDQFDHSCRPCTRICNTSSNNFSEKRCEDECQDHIHDERYARVHNNNTGAGSLAELQASAMFADLQRQVRTLQILTGISVFITCICLALVVPVFILLMKTYGGLVGKNKRDALPEKDNKEKCKTLELPTIYNNANKYPGSDVSSTGPPSLKGPCSLATISLSNNNSVAPLKYECAPISSTITQRFHREPSESTLPEYAYDNASLSPTSHHV